MLSTLQNYHIAEMSVINTVPSPFSFHTNLFLHQEDVTRSVQSTADLLTYDALIYARQHGIFKPLSVSIKAIIIAIEAQGLYLPDAEDDDHLIPFDILCEPQVIDDYPLNGYAEHVILGDFTPLGIDFYSDNYFTTIEKVIKVPVPTLRLNHDLDFSSYLAVRFWYKSVGTEPTTLPEEPLDNENDEGMEFPTQSFLALELLEGEAEFESCDDLEDGYQNAEKMLAEFDEGDVSFDTSPQNFRSRVRLITPPLSPVLAPTEPFIPWESAARVDTPDSDISSLLEKDLAVAEEVVRQMESPGVHDDDLIQRAIEVSPALSILSPPRSNLTVLHVEPPLMQTKLRKPHKDEIFIIDLTSDDVVMSQVKTRNGADSKEDETVILDKELQGTFGPKSKNLDKKIVNERPSHLITPLKVEIPNINFTHPEKPWLCSIVNVSTCLFQLMTIFPHAFDDLQRRCHTEKYGRRLKWKPWMIDPIKSIHEVMSIDLQVLRDINTWMAQDNFYLFQATERYACFNPQIGEDCVTESLSHKTPQKAVRTVLWQESSRMRPQPKMITPKVLGGTSHHFGFPTSNTLSTAQQATHPQFQQATAFLTPSKSPVYIRQSIEVEDETPLQKRQGDLLSDIIRFKKPRNPRSPGQSNFLTCQPGENQAGQHLNNFMAMMAGPTTARASKESKFFSDGSRTSLRHFGVPRQR